MVELLAISGAAFVAFLVIMLCLRRSRIRQNLKLDRPKADPVPKLEMQLIQAYKNEDYLKSQLIIDDIKKHSGDSPVVTKFEDDVKNQLASKG